eukprot:3313255-Rhodomonas_salina.1
MDHDHVQNGFIPRADVAKNCFVPIDTQEYRVKLAETLYVFAFPMKGALFPETARTLLSLLT